MTADHHTNHNSRGQRVSRYSLPTLLYFLFSPPHIFFNSIICRPANGTLAFVPATQVDPSGKSQKAISAIAQTEHSDDKADFLRILTSQHLEYCP